MRVLEKRRQACPSALLHGELRPGPAGAGGKLLPNPSDEEGWGPIRASYLEGLLGRLVEMDGVEVLPAGAALAGVDAG